MRDLTKKNQRFLKISFSNGEIGCRVLGNGIKKIIVFYGFGQTAKDYVNLSDSLPEYTFYVMDLPFHGDTTVTDPLKPIAPQELSKIVDQLIEDEGFDRFSLLGYSIGARLVFQVIEKFGTQIDDVMLFAPDGIRNNFWYQFATGSALMRGVFSKIIKNDKLLPSLISVGKTLKLVDAKTANFALRSADSQKKRQKVYYTWCYLRRLNLDVPLVSGLLNKYQIMTTFVMGKKDKIIPKKVITKLSSQLVSHKVIELNAGHHNLIQRYVEDRLSQKEVKR